MIWDTTIQNVKKKKKIWKFMPHLFSAYPLKFTFSYWVIEHLVPFAQHFIMWCSHCTISSEWILNSSCKTILRKLQFWTDNEIPRKMSYYNLGVNWNGNIFHIYMYLDNLYNVMLLVESLGGVRNDYKAKKLGDMIKKNL